MQVRFNTYYLWLRIIITYALCMGAASLQAESPTPEESGWTPKLIWEDDFVATKDQWQERDSETILYLRQGFLRFASLSKHPRWVQRAVPLNEVQHFELSSRFRLIHNVYGQTAGLVFGGNQLSHGYEFVHNGGGQYQVRVRHGREHKILETWDGPTIASQEFAELRIRQQAGKWSFFVNDRPIGDMESITLYGYEVGFVADGRVALEADFIRLEAREPANVNGPLVQLSVPQVKPNQTLHCAQPYQAIRGRVNPEVELSHIVINGEAIPVSSKGEFATALKLYEGANRVTIKAKDRAGRDFEQSFVLLHQAPVIIKPKSTPTNSTASGNVPSQTQVQAPQATGKNYLVVIGINQYQYWQPLHNAVKDCEDIVETLVRMYQFDAHNIIRITDHDATRERILETLEQLQEKVTPNDNLLIYYAGHGYYDAQAELGYWVPVDARSGKIPDYIRNSTIHDYIRTINSRNTLLIADACYAGSLFAQYRGELSVGAKSRWAFTSGDIEKVWDGRPGENSPFAYHLLSCLQENNRQVMPANDLIREVTGRVNRQTSQRPQGSPLRQAGDKGGVFLFVKR